MKEEDFKYLPHIDYPEDLRRLSVDELTEVCRELRQDIIDELAENPGHLASSLGTVEITVALHYVFNTPYDRLVWDVGHQAYGHKILTGRRDQFSTNRKLGGLRPFPSPQESEYDTFACGHASNSISAALGMSLAAVSKGEQDRHVVALIGDGAMSGGLAFEGLNNASDTPNNLLIILNDNNMSIDRAVGGMKEYLGRLHTSATYNRLRFRLSRQLARWGMLNEERRRTLIRFNNSLKSLITHQQNIFEGMNIRYFGPTDGHNVVELVRILREIKDMKGPKLLHIHTVKGKGFKPAEEAATIWHAPGKYDPENGHRLETHTADERPRFQDVFGETLLELARRNPRIVGVTPAMPTGCSMCIMMKEMPERTFDVGIAEGHAVTFSAGMAKEGLQPFCNIYSSFAQRAYDNIIHDTALLSLPVVLCLDRAGLVGEDGPTHHGAFDLAALRPIPHLTIASPLDAEELRRLMYTAQLEGKGTFVIRYPRGRVPATTAALPSPYKEEVAQLQGAEADAQLHDAASSQLHDSTTSQLQSSTTSQLQSSTTSQLQSSDSLEIPVGRGRRLKDGEDMAVITLGPVGVTAADAIADVERETGRSVALYDLRFLKPLDDDLLKEVGTRFTKVLTVEDGVREGGMGSAVLEWMADHGYTPRIVRLGLPDEFVEHGDVASLHRIVGIDREGIAKAIRNELKRES